MNNVNPEFNFTDALLLFSIGYCNHHNYPATLGHILLETDATNREMPMRQELENGFSRLIVGGYIQHQGELFTITEAGIRLYEGVTRLPKAKFHVLDKIRLLASKLNASRVDHVSKQITITDAQHAEAMQEADAIFREASKKADEILRARNAK